MTIDLNNSVPDFLKPNFPDDPKDAKWQWNLIGGGFGRGGGGRGGIGDRGRGRRVRERDQSIDIREEPNFEEESEEVPLPGVEVEEVPLPGVELEKQQRRGRGRDRQGRGRGGRGKGKGGGGGPRFMLNTDMELAYEIDVDRILGTSCTVNENEPGIDEPEGPGNDDGPDGDDDGNDEPGVTPGRGRGRGGRGGHGGRGGRGSRGGRGGRGRGRVLLQARENDEICPAAITRDLVQEYAEVSIIKEQEVTI